MISPELVAEKPRGASPTIHSSIQATICPDHEETGSVADGSPGLMRQRRGERLWRTLEERHINMIAFSGSIGNGLFLGSGQSLASAGPGGALVSYIVIGTVISSVISCLGEMTALMPVNAPMMEFPRRFLDRGVGFAVGWVYWFAYAVLASNQLVAVTNIIKFRYDDGTTFLHWQTGEDVDHAIWFIVFLVVVTLVNMLPVKAFAELEYVFGSIKMIFIITLILMMVIVDTMNPRPNAYYSEPIGTQYWNTPYRFFKQGYQFVNQQGEEQDEITGSLGTLLGVWSTLINVMFSYVGMEIFAATAAESRALSDSESIKMAARKINIRIITLYSFTVLLASFVVRTDHPMLRGEGQSVGARSLFIIAVVEAGMPAVAHFFNAMFVFSSCTCAINSMYIASRVLHTLALRGQTGPDFITRRLRLCGSGVPIRTVLVTGGMMLIGFMGRSGSPGARMNELANNCTVSLLIVYCAICASYLSFYRVLKNAQLYGRNSGAPASSYDRDDPAYPYKSHAQWLKASYGMVACMLLILFNGVTAFLEKPYGWRRFVSSYISLRNHGFSLSKWASDRSEELGQTVQVRGEKRKGRLELPDESLTKANLKTFAEWIWVWLK
ncbi:hypothetical protein N3K66_007824 [Trichothecium roseum]|uniref:Uncharacterized protein n=1 Tax=Trichothecium roseum TaxID=47278 RepID=A0ACC0UTF2_9HYPO|nr:hypothetical protein N3K66_007824 [Trichothecium roseum]